jgi:hypothetical protein
MEDDLQKKERKTTSTKMEDDLNTLTTVRFNDISCTDHNFNFRKYFLKKSPTPSLTPVRKC